jgi:hypothetical protein
MALRNEVMKVETPCAINRKHASLENPALG